MADNILQCFSIKVNLIKLYSKKLLRIDNVKTKQSRHTRSTNIIPFLLTQSQGYSDMKHNDILKAQWWYNASFKQPFHLRVIQYTMSPWRPLLLYWHPIILLKPQLTTWRFNVDRLLSDTLPYKFMSCNDLYKRRDIYRVIPVIAIRVPFTNRD